MGLQKGHLGWLISASGIFGVDNNGGIHWPHVIVGCGYIKPLKPKIN